MKMGHYSPLALMLVLSLCLPTPSLREALPDPSPVQFVDVTSESKIAFKHENGASKDKLVVETFGSGVAWIDYDNDGLVDLYFANGANLYEGKPSPGNVLLHTTGKGTFVDVTKDAS